MSGYVIANGKDIRSILQADFYVYEKHPQIQIDQCSIEIEDLEINIGGGVIPWIVDLFRPQISILVKKIVHEQVCFKDRTIHI